MVTCDMQNGHFFSSFFDNVVALLCIFLFFSEQGYHWKGKKVSNDIIIERKVINHDMQNGHSLFSFFNSVVADFFVPLM